MSEPYKLPTWIEGMISAMADYVHAGCGPEDAKRIGALVGDTAATLAFVHCEERS